MAERARFEELLDDRGVLVPAPVLEFAGWRAAAATGGSAVLPWRSDWLAARAAGADAHPHVDEVDQACFTQSVVHLQKSRDATWRDLHAAWTRLEPGGHLLFCGGNELGVVSAVKRLAREIGQTPRVLSNRRRARVVLFERGPAAGPAPAATAPVPAGLGDAAPVALEAAPGVFSAKRLDPGTEMLLEALGRHDTEPQRILDLGCGIGPLGLAALLRWPRAQATLVDADARAVASAARNAERIGASDRCTVVWWDAAEPAPAERCDLVLLNPPFHAGKAVDLGPARAMFAHAAGALAPGGTALIVANRTLPYERDLESIGRVRALAETRHYKVLSLRGRTRPSGSSGRSSRPARRRGGG